LQPKTSTAEVEKKAGKTKKVEAKMVKKKVSVAVTAKDEEEEEEEDASEQAEAVRSDEE